MEKILAHLRQGQFDTAIELTQAAIQDNPGDPALHELLGVACFESGRLQQAKRAFDEQVRLAPDNACAHANLGQLSLELGEYDSASRHCMRAIEIDPMLDSAYNTLGNIDRAAGRLTSAAKYYAKAVSLNGEDPYYLCNLGAVEAELGDLDQAERHLSTAVRLAPEFVHATNNYAAILQKQKRFREAVTVYEQALAQDPDNANLINNLGACLAELGERNKATKHFKQAIQIAPKHAGAYVNLALQEEDRNNLAGAIDCYTKAIEYEPNNHTAFGNLGALYLRLGRIEEAIDAFTNALQSNPDYGYAYAGLADAAITTGDLNAAAADLARAVLFIADTAYFHEVMARLHEARDEGQKAVAEFNEAIKCEGESGTARYALALYYTRTGQYELAEEQFALLRPTADANVLVNWAAMEEKRHHIQRAEELLVDAKAIAGQYTAPMRLLSSRLKFRAGDYADALRELGCVEMESIDNLDLRKDCLFQMGRIYDRLTDYEQAYDCFDAANATRGKLLGTSAASSPGDDYAHYEQVFENIERPCFDADPDHVPVFIVGFPRSGTTLLEQIISAHPSVVAGDELPYIFDLAGRKASKIIGSDQPYPQCLLQLSNVSCGALRDFYLEKSKRLARPGSTHFTDKMPLNLTQLGLIHLLFPSAPIIHIIRHPLDACFSTWSTNFTQLRFSSDLESTAKYYRRVMELTQFYKHQFTLKYMELRYEDLLDEPENHIRRIIDFIGLDWDERCLAFHENENVSRTASYEQVTQKIYRSSRYRYLNYFEYLQDIVPVLRDIIDQLGYRLDGPEN